MSPGHTPTTEGNDPDAFVIVHHPLDGSDAYGIGPFPWIEELAQHLLANAACNCRLETLSIAFPAGITMVVAPLTGEPDELLN